MSLSDVYEKTFDESHGTIDTTTCPECPGDLVTDGGETTCTECGLIVDEYWIDHGPEHFSEDIDERKRTGPPVTPTRHDRGISTEIGRKYDGNRNALSGKKRRQLGRLRVQHSRGRWRTKADRNLAFGLTEVRRIVSALDLSNSVCDQACRLFRSAQDADLLPGRSIEAFAAASVYAACRCNDLPWTMRELGESARVSRDRVANAYGVMNRELGLPTAVQSPSRYVPRFATELDVADRVRRTAEALAERAMESKLDNGRNPAGLAAACLYEAAQRHDDGVSQRELGECADVSPMTVRNRWREVSDLMA